MWSPQLRRKNKIGNNLWNSYNNIIYKNEKNYETNYNMVLKVLFFCQAVYMLNPPPALCHKVILNNSVLKQLYTANRMKVKTKLNLWCNNYEWKVTSNNHSSLLKFTGYIWYFIYVYVYDSITKVIRIYPGLPVFSTQQSLLLVKSFHYIQP